MTMSSSSERELEEQLLDAGNMLADPPSSVDELLLLLDRIEYCLVRVDQSPTSSMLNALSPSLNALVVDKLLHHPNDDVKVAVASCISEITRITAPDAPYDDNQMKEVFQLIVSSFVNLSDHTSRSYAKRTSILGTVSKVRSCVVMLDLECDTLIVEMFEHFLKAIREYHTDNVYSSMETIMTLVLEESEDISKELLSPILACVKNNNEVLPIARKLAETVLESCAAKVKPYLIEAVNSLGISLDDYSLVVATICDQETTSAVEQGDGHATPDQMGEENKLERTSSEDAMQVDKEIATGETLPDHGDPAIEKSPKSVVSNDITQTREEESILDSNSKMQEDSHNDQLKSTNSISNAEPDNLDNEKVDQTTKRMGRKPSSSEAKEPSDGSHIEDEKEAKEPQDDHESNIKDDASSPCKEPLDDHESNMKDDANSPCKEPLNDHESNIKDDANSPCKEPSIDAAVSSGHEKSKELESESGNCASPFPGESLPEEGRARKAGRPKKEISSIKVTKTLESGSGNTASSSPRLKIAEEGRARKGGRPKKVSSTTKDPAPPDGESEKLASPSPSESLPEEGIARKGGRPKKKETLSTKDTTPLENESGKATSPSPSEGGLPEEGRAQKAGRPKKVSSITKDTMPLDIESGNVASPSPSESLPEVGRARKPGRSKKKEISAIKDTLPSINAISKQAAEATSDSEVKQTKHSGKKPSFGISNDDINATVVTPKNESGAGSDSEVNASKEPGKKVEMSGDDGDGSFKHSENKKKRGRPKTVIEKDMTKSFANDDTKETVSSPKSNTKSIKDENRIEETPQTNSKRKHTPVVEKQSGDKSGEDLVGSKIKVWWPKDRKFYEGVVDFYDSAKKKHKVLYIDGDEETLNLKTQKWQLVACDSNEGKEAEESSPDSSSDAPQKKRARTIKDLSAKQGKREVTSKRGGGASSSKAKGSAAKSGLKTKDAGGSDSKTISELFKKSDNDSASKSKSQTPKGGNKAINPSKAANKTKDDDSGATKSTKPKDVEITPKTSPKTKQETPNTGKGKQANKSKGKTPKSGGGGGGRSSSNGNSKAKSGSSKVDEDEDMEEASSADSAEAPEIIQVQVKTTDSSNKQPRAGKKRRRGGKS